MPLNSRRKGKAGELEFIQKHLARVWPAAKRNLDQFQDDKRDALEVDGFHFQIKRAERAEIWAWIKQAETEAAEGDVPVVAFRRNRSRWYCVVDAERMMELIERGRG
jgi:hypothetical protein